MAEIDMQPEFEGSSDNIEIWLDGFIGYVNEVRISNIVLYEGDP